MRRHQEAGIRDSVQAERADTEKEVCASERDTGWGDSAADVSFPVTGRKGEEAFREFIEWWDTPVDFDADEREGLSRGSN